MAEERREELNRKNYSTHHKLELKKYKIKGITYLEETCVVCKGVNVELEKKSCQERLKDQQDG